MKEINEERINRIYNHITDYQRKYGKSPSYREIMKSCTVSSLSVVKRYVEILIERGMIERAKEEELSPIGTFAVLAESETINVPLVGVCPCGKPIEAIENIEGSFRLPTEIFGSDAHFMLRAKGNSMIESGINDGDLMVVRRQEIAEEGEIVIALIDGEATAKVLYSKSFPIVLRAANDNIDEEGNRLYPDIIAENCAILGIVDNVIHRPRYRK